MQFKQTVEVRR